MVRGGFLAMMTEYLQLEPLPILFLSLLPLLDGRTSRAGEALAHAGFPPHQCNGGLQPSCRLCRALAWAGPIHVT